MPPIDAPVLVIGAGTMGSGIAQVFAAAGFSVLLADLAPPALERGMRAISGSLERLARKGKISAEAARETSARVAPSTSLEGHGKVGFIVEAVYEDPEVKKGILARLDAAYPDAAAIASNTSSISITSLAAATRRPERVIGMHFFNPVPVMELVEVIRGQRTGPEVVENVIQLARRLGKTPVAVEDYPGFVSNRVLMPMINEAIGCLREGVAAREAIDTVMRLGMNHPVGPLQLADLIGLDVCLSILEVLQRDLGDPKYRPDPLLRRLVAAGHLGKKSGMGFYRYEPAV